MAKAKKYYQGEPDYAVSPGAILADVLEQRNMTQLELANRLGVSKKTVNELVRGGAPLRCETACGLERVLGVSASFWLNAENIYRTRLKRREENLARHEEILKIPAMKELQKRNLLPKPRTVEEGIENVLKFFRIGTVEKLRQYWDTEAFGSAALRHSTKIEGDLVALATWLQIGLNETVEMNCAPYDANAFRKALAEIRKFTTESPSEFVPKMKDLCACCGVALAFVPEFKNAAVNGAARWLTSEKAAIFVNLRGKKSDIFWFTFFHEAAHILSQKKKTRYIDFQKSYPNDEEEQAADKFAGEFLIPSRYTECLKTLKTVIKVRGFAQTLGIHPGIVVGRLQHDGIIPFSHMNNLKTSYDWTELILREENEMN